MARKLTPSRQFAKLFHTVWSSMSRPQQLAVVLVMVAILIAIGFVSSIQAPIADPSGPGSLAPEVAPPPSKTGEKSIIFCHWNMENLFDDCDDKRRRQPDEDFDNWFVNDPAAREQKYRRLADVLLKLNSGIGPDIIVGNEIESYRAAELLRDTLSASLPSSTPRYEHIAMKELDAGRHIAPCVISRYPLSNIKLLGRLQRILQVTVTANGHDLVLIGSHWTSQLSDKGADPTRGRGSYATVIHNAYRDAVRKNPDIDFLVCGDFNDTPESESVAQILKLTSDVKSVTQDAKSLRLFGPLSEKSPAKFGTHYYQKPLIYDQLGLSPGLLDDSGWSYVADSTRVPTDGLIRSGDRSRRPWRYGSRSDNAVGRGFSDHFPIVAALRVAP